MSSAACLRCAAPRVPGPECPHCGVVYAKAARRAAAPVATTEPGEPDARGTAESVEAGPGFVRRPATRGPSAAAVFALESSLSEARAEVWLARLAVPVALLASWVLVQMGMGRFFFRTFSGMWLHELGHAVVAWFCGFPAFPGPWMTSVGEDRSVLFALAITGGLGFAAWRGWSERDRLLTASSAGALVLQLAGTLLVPERTARTLITFGGGAGSLVFGAALMAAFAAPPGHKLHRDSAAGGE